MEWETSTAQVLLVVGWQVQIRSRAEEYSSDITTPLMERTWPTRPVCVNSLLSKKKLQRIVAICNEKMGKIVVSSRKWMLTCCASKRQEHTYQHFLLIVGVKSSESIWIYKVQIETDTVKVNVQVMDNTQVSMPVASLFGGCIYADMPSQCFHRYIVVDAIKF